MPALNTSLSIDEQIALLERGTVDIVPLPELKAKLLKSAKEGKPLQVKLGLDPTAPDIHLGFAVVLRKLRQFQDLGHEVVIIIGDYTALIGDPSGRSTTRPMLSSAEIEANGRTYVEQLAKVLDRDKTIIRFNSEWLGKLSFADLVGLASKMTVAQVLQREDFAHRFREGLPISLHELLYPLAQAYDSVAISADVEMGGQDQTFNNLAGRALQKELGQEPQVVLLMPLLVGLDGVKKMSKSLGNYVGISETPPAMFGKLMSLSDDLMPMYYELCTDVPMDEVRTLTDAARTHPREAKKRLAREIITLYHGGEAAQAADDEFERVHKEHQVPDEMPEVAVPAELCDAAGHARVAGLLVATGLAPSGGEAKRLILQGGVSVDSEKIVDAGALVLVKTGQVIKVGRNRFGPADRAGRSLKATLHIGSRMAELETQPTLMEEAPAAPPPTDPALFEAEMNPHLDALYRNALRLTGNANDAEDLLQDTYLRAYRFFYQYQPGTNAKAWLFRIMNTVFLNDYRRKSRQGETVSYDGLEDFYLYNRLTEDGLGGDHPETENPEKAVLEKLDIEIIQQAIQALPIEFRDTVALATVEEMSYQEIADTLDIPVGTVRSRLSRGRKLLQRALWEYLSGEEIRVGEAGG